MGRRCAFLVGVVMAALGAALPSAVAARNAEIQRFATAEFPPYVDRSAPEGGYYPALIRRVLAHHGARVAFVERPWPRAHLETARGRFDGSFPYLHSAARAREFLFSDPLLRVSSHLYVRRGQAATPPDDLVREARRTCYLRDSLLPPSIESRIAEGGLRVVRVDDMAQCFRMLEAGRVDFVCAGVFNARATLQRVFGDAPPVVAIGAPLDDSTLHLVWPRSDPRSEARREAFNASLRALEEAGEVSRLQRRLLPQGDRAAARDSD